ncbi:MAG: energy transducer TonB [Bacteroidota bacterium]
MDHQAETKGIFDTAGCLSRQGIMMLCEGKLEISQQESVQQHLAACEFCSIAVEGWKLLLEKQDVASLESLTFSLHTSIDEKVRTETKRRHRRKLWLRGSLIAAAASISLLVSFYFILRNDNRLVQEDLAMDKTVGAGYTEMNRPPLAPMEQASKVQFTAPQVVGDSVVESNSLNQEELAVTINNSTEENLSVEAKVEEKVIEEEDKSPPFTVVEEMPSYPGGEEVRLKFLQENIQYPQTAKESGIQGTVYVSFVIDTKGKISEVKVLRGIGGGCDQEAIRVIKLMPSWLAGKQAGKPVRVQFTMPIKFTLN